MKEKLGSVFEFFKQVFQEWGDDKAPRLAAALAYYTIFSLAPILIIVVAVAGLVFGAQQAQTQIVGELSGLIGPSGADLITSLLENANRPREGIIATIFGIVVIILGASGVFGELKDALNTIWNVTPKPNQGVLTMVRDRLLSFAIVLAIGFLLLVSLVLSAGLSAFGNWLQGYLSQWVMVAQVLSTLISLLVVTVLFAILFKFLPDIQVAWRDVWGGAFITALLFTLGKFLIGFYIGNSNVASPYGAAGSVIVLLIWVFYSAQILFLGAEITQVYASRYGAGVKPAEDAVPLSEEKRIAQGTLKPNKGAVMAAAAKGTSAEEETGKEKRGEADRAKPSTLPNKLFDVKYFLMVWGAFVAAFFVKQAMSDDAPNRVPRATRIEIKRGA